MSGKPGQNSFSAVGFLFSVSLLDEFYKVRFSDVKRRILIAQERSAIDDGKDLLTKMQAKAAQLEKKFDELYNDLLLEMARRNIFLVNETQLNEAQQAWVKKYFRKQVLPHITPLLMTEDIDFL